MTQDPLGFSFSRNTTADSYGLLNTFSFFRGRHFMKMGFDYRIISRIRVETQGGQFDFSPLATAIPRRSRFRVRRPATRSPVSCSAPSTRASCSTRYRLGQHRHYAALFFQDDFKVSQRLTLNLGTPLGIPAAVL